MPLKNNGVPAKGALLKNTIMLIILQLSTYVLAIAAVPYETRVLGPEVYGTVGVMTAVTVYFALFIDFGFLISAVADVSANRDDHTALSRIFTAVMVCKLILTALSVLFLFLLCAIIPSWRENSGLLILFFTASAISCLIPDFIYRGLEKMTALTLRTVFVRSFFTAAIFVFLRSPEDVYIIPVLNIIGNCLAFLWSYFDLRRFSVKLVKISRNHIKDAFARSFSFFFSRIATTAYTALNTVILDLIARGGAATGFYTSADKLVVTGKNLLSPISDSLYPYMVKTHDYRPAKKLLSISTPLIIAASVPVYLYAHDLCRFIFGAEYGPAGDILRAMMPVAIITLPNYVCGFPVLTAMGIAKYANYSVIFGSVLHTVALLILWLTDSISTLSLAALVSVTEAAILIFRLTAIIIHRNRLRKKKIVVTSIIRKVAVRAAWVICRLLPIKGNKIAFVSFGGKGFGGNPKAIALALHEKRPDLDLVWLTSERDHGLPDFIRPVRFGTFAAVCELSTSKVWVNDSRGGELYKKKGQFYLQTWHGFAHKKIEAAADKSLPESYIRQCKRDSSHIDLIVSGSRFMTNIYRRDFWYSGEIAEYGTPRNDVFFSDATSIQTKVIRSLSLPEGRKLLLYAPTFRHDGSLNAYKLDVSRVADACARRFGGEWTVLVRLHPNVAKKSEELFAYDGKTAIDATSYPDMQELLVAADVLLTDYSSSMFDFALTKKPCFRYAGDLDAYIADRGFYFPAESLPFPLATHEDELALSIISFDSEAYCTSLKRFTDENGFCEDGFASSRASEAILSRLR